MVKMNYNLNKYGRSIPIWLEAETYADNGNLAIEMYSNEEGWMATWGRLTVNLSDKLPREYAYVDTNNHGKDVMKWIESNELGEFTGMFAKSGYCSYPCVKFDLDKLK